MLENVRNISNIGVNPLRAISFDMLQEFVAWNGIHGNPYRMHGNQGFEARCKMTRLSRSDKAANLPLLLFFFHSFPCLLINYI